MARVTDDQWNKITTAMNMLGRQMGLGSDYKDFEEVFKEHWDLLHDTAALDTYLDTQELAELEAKEVEQAADLGRLKQTIADKKKPTPKIPEVIK